MSSKRNSSSAGKKNGASSAGAAASAVPAVQITPDLVKRTTGEYDLEMVQWLDLSNRGIRKIECLSNCISMIDLCLSGNRIRHVEGLEALICLQRLDLSSNKISRIGKCKKFWMLRIVCCANAGLETLQALQHLDLRGNQITNVDDVRSLSQLSNLKHFYLKDYSGDNANPACNHPAYHIVVTKCLKHLEILDGESLNLRQCMADVILDRVQADPEAAKPLPHQRWCAAADWALPSVEATVDDALQDSIGGLQEALKSCAEASREADRLLRQMGDPAGEGPMNG
ncbi:hypothetical protein JKP88DRAFT_291738 [Tribonema minus]|uniref:Leucine-rich repeat-containing protein 61 n=1 Tax=Tribonema minus TaxID=303371 RepID=A0A835ZEL2_9STRA|nr:hypothetical protein JKP88DRAFT_291738 [Tribonema minus]